MKNFIINMIPWIINFGYCLSLAPQIYLNYKNRSTKGLSDFFIVGNFTGYLLYFWHAYTFNFPLAYKVLLPVTAIISFIWVLQSFIYSEFETNQKRFFLYFFTIFLLVFLALVSIYFPKMSGNISGWVSTVIWYLYLVPQAIRIYKKKSVKGFSSIFVIFIGIGGFVELASAVFCKLSPQIYFNAIRGFLFFIIFLIQFIKYRK